MKQILLMIAVVALVGCGGKALTNEESAKVIEAAIRKTAKKPTGELTKADYMKAAEVGYGTITSENPDHRHKFDLSRKELTDVKGLEKLTKLNSLALDKNQLTSVKGLENLTQLEVLFLNNNQLTDVKGLGKLTQLRTLSLSDNPDLTKAQIAELQKVLPKCTIHSNPKK
jgi:Leucine-rich repeat (LRR) protein